MPDFPHLKIQAKIDGPSRPKRGGGDNSINSITQSNRDNRDQYGTSLLSNLDNISNQWIRKLELRAEANLPELPNPNITSIFLQVDTEKFDIESLKSFGIEIIAEEEDGYIIGAASVEFVTLKEKINKFILQEGKYENKAAELWNITGGDQWKIDYILSEKLKENWSNISNEILYSVDIGIACYIKISNPPHLKKDEEVVNFQRRLERWEVKKLKQERSKDDLAMKRQEEFETLVFSYSGEILSSYIDFEDSFSCRIRINGKGLKDLVLNYPYLFEVSETEELFFPLNASSEIDNISPELIPPQAGDPKVCIIDSGIQENHRLLELAIETTSSYSFVGNENDTSDISPNGGHGTKVAGAVLFQNNIPKNGNYQLPCFIQNVKVLELQGGRCILPNNLYPPELMQKIVSKYEGTKIFNLSICSSVACRSKHMSQWASSIDKLIFDKNILFLISVGNISLENNNPLNPGIKNHLSNGRNYPAYLLQNSSRIANPSQSCFAISVGSICLTKYDDDFKESFGSKDEPSSFSRTGLGLWGMVKPDVVEYAGDFVREKNDNPNITNEVTISPELVKSTYNGGGDVGRDSVGTSFSTPNVTHIAAHLQKIYPDEHPTLYRSLIIQSARLPGEIFRNPNLNHIRHFGYGLPSLQRATQNTAKRITLIASNEISPDLSHIYSVDIPDSLRSPGDNYDYLVEITLSYYANPRRTRMRTQSYLSTWVDWEPSKKNESYNQFKDRVVKLNDELNSSDDLNVYKWKIRESKEWSKIRGLRRQDSTIQKSWCIMKSHELPEQFSIAVIGHAGWQKDKSSKVPYSIAISFEILNEEINIYNPISIKNRVEVPVNEIEIQV